MVKMELFKNLNQKQRLAFIIISTLILVGIIIFIFIFTMRIGKVKVTIQYAPYSAKVTLNGTEVKNKSETWLQPGKYTAIIECEHFESVERVVDISGDYNYIVGVLHAIDDEGTKYINSHKQEFVEVEGLVGHALTKEGIAIKKKYPILNYLPINNRLFSISYAYTDENEPIINVKTSPEFLDDAVAKMKTLKNVDLTAYQINFTPSNPFAIYEESAQSKPEDTIKSTFKLDKYKLSKGQNIAGEYYATTIYTYDYDRDLTYGHYRVLLKKKDDKWHLVAAPQPLLTKQNTPDTAVDILNSANSLAP